MKREKLYDKAVELWGIESQIHVTVEEMSELIKVLMKGFRGELNIENLIDELADTEIMIEQLKFIFGLNDKVSKRKEYKKKRLEKRLK